MFFMQGLLFLAKYFEMERISYAGFGQKRGFSWRGKRNFKLPRKAPSCYRRMPSSASTTGLQNGREDEPALSRIIATLCLALVTAT